MLRNDQRPSRYCHNGPSVLLACVAASTLLTSCVRGSELSPNGEEAGIKADPAAIEFFEKSVRPILATRCQGCHGPAKQKGGLRLDARAALITGGSTGPAVVPGNPKDSLLVDAINYGEAYQMPPKSKLPAAEIATLTEWVKRGAPWGVESRADPAGSTPHATIAGQLSRDEFKERARYWSFQPIRKLAPPLSPSGRRGWARNPIDLFIQATLAERTTLALA